MAVERKRALLIGNSRFADARLARLFAPSSDVKALQSVLKDEQIGAFDEVDILIDEPMEKVRRELATLCVGASVNDLLLVYYTGHGVLDPWHNTLHLAFEQTTLDLPEADGLEADWVRARLDRCRASRQVFILD
jgi:hypothetical protein